MKNPFSFETLTEQGKTLGKAISSQVKPTPPSTQNQGQLPNTDAAGNLGQDQNTQDFVNQLYGPMQTTSGGQAAQMAQQAQASADQQRLEEARKKLHMETYYIPTFEQKKQEGSTGERLEREEMEKKQEEAKKMELEQKKAERPAPPGKGAERTPGASG